jgi:hypothetical protein
MRRFIVVLACALLASGGQQGPQNTGVYMLFDTSGICREKLVKAEQIIRYALSWLGETDTSAVARIDTGCFREKDTIAKASFDDRPSAVNRQKRVLAQQVTDFVKSGNSSPHTDISGGRWRVINDPDGLDGLLDITGNLVRGLVVLLTRDG